MGTSTDTTGPRGGHWSQVRSNATRYAKNRDRKYAERALSQYVAALGGAVAAAGHVAAGRAAAQRLGAFAAGVAAYGLDQALDDVGLGHLVGRDRYEVLDALVTYIAGDGSSRDIAAARDAAIAALRELFDDDATEYGDLPPDRLDAEAVADLLVHMLAEVIYAGVAEIMHERIARQNVDDEAALEAEVKEIVRNEVHLNLAPRSALDVDWQGDEGRQILDDAVHAAYQVLGDEE